jgi:DNA-binding NarL/FixJ family response regulator
MRCLVIDDDPRDRELVERIVMRAGHDVQGASGGESALEFARSQAFDVALVDLGMQGMDGVQTLRALRKECPELRLLVVSGFDDRMHVLDAVGAGADGYLLKTELVNRLGPALEEIKTGGRPRSRGSSSKSCARRPTGHDRATMTRPPRNPCRPGNGKCCRACRTATHTRKSLPTCISALTPFDTTFGICTESST